jgi:hypothetical protein
MNPNVLIAVISAGGSVLVSVTALILAYRGFASIDSRFGSIDSRFASIEGRFASIERRLDLIQADIKQFFEVLAEHDKRIQRLEDKSR